MIQDIAHNLTNIKTLIADTAHTHNRNNDNVRLIAVSKRQPDERIIAALDAGHRHFGENRVQEAYDHWHERRAHYPNLTLHLIGPLQSNKTAEAVALFDVIHTVDRKKIARYLGREMTAQNRHLPCYIQVNTGEESQKSGILPCEVHNFYTYCRNDAGLNIIGLMCIPPMDEHAAFHFALLKKMADEMDLKHISMGMSADFDTAIQFGSTDIRIGTGIFGARLK